MWIPLSEYPVAFAELTSSLWHYPVIREKINKLQNNLILNSETTLATVIISDQIDKIKYMNSIFLLNSKNKVRVLTYSTVLSDPGLQQICCNYPWEWTG